ncbi:MAG TPA: entericidin [Bacteroidia bacterium]|nr:entericidin [Bacteroidia bacterium]
MKKLLTLVLAAGMLTIYSCGGGSESTEGTTTDSAAAPEAAPVEAAPADSAAMPADTAAH